MKYKKLYKKIFNEIGMWNQPHKQAKTITIAGEPHTKIKSIEYSGNGIVGYIDFFKNSDDIIRWIEDDDIEGKYLHNGAYTELSDAIADAKQWIADYYDIPLKNIEWEEGSIYEAIDTSTPAFSKLYKLIKSATKIPFKVSADENIITVKLNVHDPRPIGIAFKNDGVLSQEYERNASIAKAQLKDINDLINMNFNVQDSWIDDAALSVGFVSDDFLVKG